MAKISKKSATAYGMSGKVGNIIYYNDKGGTSAMIYNDTPRTEKTNAQVVYQSQWGNLIRVWRAFEQRLKDNFQSKPSGHRDYNAFIKMNMKSQHTKVYLSKDVSELGGCVLADFMISCGSLPEITCIEGNGTYKTNIRLGDLVINSDTTIGDLSVAISRNNNGRFKIGDQISLHRAYQKVHSSTNVPYVQTVSSELNLNESCDDKIWEKLPSFCFENVDGFLGNTESSSFGYGFAYIHSRKEDNVIMVSTQSLIVKNDAMLEEYTGNAALIKAQKSYGARSQTFTAPNADGSSGTYGYYYDEEPTGKYRLTVQSESLDKGTVSGGGMFEEGANPTFSATPKAGYEFEGWYRDGEKFSEEATCTDFDMPAANVTVTARFRAVAATHTIILTAGANGKVKVGDGEPGTTATGSVEDGGTIVINAIANSGYQFQKWSDSNMQNPRTLTNVTEDVELTATFESEE